MVPKNVYILSTEDSSMLYTENGQRKTLESMLSAERSSRPMPSTEDGTEKRLRVLSTEDSSMLYTEDGQRKTFESILSTEDSSMLSTEDGTEKRLRVCYLLKIAVCHLQ